MHKVKEKKIDLMNSNWVFLVNRNMSYLHNWLANIGYGKYNGLYGISKRLITLGIMKGMNASTFRTEKESLEFTNQLLSKALTSDGLNKLRAEYIKRGQNLMEAARSLSSAKVSNSKKLLINYFETYKKYTPTLNITAIGGAYLTKELYQVFSALQVKTDFNKEAMSIVTLPDSLTPSEIEEIDLLTIATKPKFTWQSLLKKHYEKYQHLPSNFVGEGWTFADIKKRFSTIDKKNAKKILALRKKGREQALKKRDIIFKKLRPSSKLIKLVLAIRTFSDLNEYRKSIFTEASFITRRYFSLLAKELKIGDWKSCHYLSEKDVLSLLAHRHVSQIKNKIKNRQNGYYGNFYNGFDSQDLSPSSVRWLMNKYMNKKKSLGNIIQTSGFSGNVGLLTGRAIVIRSSRDFSKVKSGDILIASMTSTDYIMIMKKAAAFVTDEGGLTSHPAIVAREMNKPCIVGTKNATMIFKTGDLVEVDGYKGIVRLIKKSRR